MKSNLHLLEAAAVAAGLGACINTAVYAAEADPETEKAIQSLEPETAAEFSDEVVLPNEDQSNDPSQAALPGSAEEADTAAEQKEGAEFGDSAEPENTPEQTGDASPKTDEEKEAEKEAVLNTGVDLSSDGKTMAADAADAADENKGDSLITKEEQPFVMQTDPSQVTVIATEPQLTRVTRTVVQNNQTVTLTGYVVNGSALPDLSKINADFIVIQATGGTSYVNGSLSRMADAILKGGYLLGIYHEAGQGGYKTTAEMEAYTYYAATRNYVGRFLPILKYTTMTADTGPAWVKDFLDTYYGLTGVRGELQTTAANRANGDWREVDKEYKTTENLAAYEGTRSDWQAAVKAVKTPNVKELYRMFNPNTGEHFYTAAEKERDYLVPLGWQYENIGWTAPASGQAVYRLYNPNTGDHHYTLNKNERDVLIRLGWKDEGVGWQSDTSKKTPVYRSYNPNAVCGIHHFTSSLTEHQYLVSIGWRDEGIAWYGTVSTVPRNPTINGSYLVGDYGYNTKRVKLSGVQKVGGSFYYFNPAKGGVMDKGTGLVTVSGTSNKVYVNSDGKLTVGQKRIDGTWRWFRPENALMAVNSFIDIPAAYNSGTAKTCYYDGNGNMVAGTRTINGLSYVFDSNSGAWTNRVDVDIQKLCQSVYQQVGRDLKAVYDWCVRSIVYQTLPIPLNPPAGYTVEQNYAIRGLKDKKGNCYCYAAAVTNLARNLGYQARFCTGGVLLANGSYSNHGWCEVTINGTRYILDAEAETEYRNVSFYMQPASRPKLTYKEY